jgi:hypothetical protein
MANFKDVKIRKCEMKLFGCDENVGRWNYYPHIASKGSTHGQWIVGRQVKYQQIVGRQMNVGWEIIVGWKKYVGRGNSIGRHRKVGRERPLPTGLTVTDKIGGRNWFATNFVSVNVAFPTNLYVGFLVLWCSERGISDPWILLKSNFGAIFFSKRATPFHYCNITEINKFN